MSSYGRIRDICGNPIPYGNLYATVMMTTVSILMCDTAHTKQMMKSFYFITDKMTRGSLKLTNFWLSINDVRSLWFVELAGPSPSLFDFPLTSTC